MSAPSVSEILDAYDHSLAGAVVTVWALLGAVREFKRGNSQNVNRYLRFRVVAQGATVVAMLAGSFIYEKSMADQKEQDKAAEKERMYRILDALPPSNPELPPAPLPVPAPAIAETAPPPLESSPTPELENSAEPRLKQTRYVGENDQWREFFERKNAEKAAASRGDVPPPPTKDTSKPPEGKKGWFPWSS